MAIVLVASDSREINGAISKCFCNQMNLDNFVLRAFHYAKRLATLSFTLISNVIPFTFIATFVTNLSSQLECKSVWLQQSIVLAIGWTLDLSLWNPYQVTTFQHEVVKLNKINIINLYQKSRLLTTKSWFPWMLQFTTL